MQVLILITKLIAVVIVLEVIIRQPAYCLWAFLKFYFKIYRPQRAPWQKRKLRWYLFIHIPREYLTTAITAVYILFLYNFNASWVLLIAVSGWMFKKIIQDPLFILHTYILNLFSSQRESSSQESNFSLPSAIYMPHLGYSREEIETALEVLFLSYFNNRSTQPVVMYHSDNRDPELIYQALKIAKTLSGKFNINNFLFWQRNIQLPERNFLGKPGAYLADYQRIVLGIKQPVIYTEKEWDGRLQYKFRLDGDKIVEEKMHQPFVVPSHLEDSYRYFIIYDGGKYLLEEKLYLETDSKKFEAEVKINFYLVNKKNPLQLYRVYMGAIYDLEGKLIYSPRQWEMHADGRISIKHPLPVIDSGPYHLIIERVIFLNNRKFYLDREMNIRNENYEIFISGDKYRLVTRYLAYKRRGNFLHLVDNNFHPDSKKFIGSDFRRNPFQDMHRFPQQVVEKINEDPDFDYFEKIQIQKEGIWGNQNLISDFATGWENEYLIPDKLHKYRIILKGGYYLIPEKYKSKDIFYAPHRQRQIVYQDRFYGIEGEAQFPLIPIDGSQIPTAQKYILIKAEFIEKLRVCDEGYIFTENSNFIIREGKLYYLGEEPELIFNNPQPLSKALIYIDARDNSLKKRKLVAPPGGYYLDQDKILLTEKIISGRIEAIVKGKQVKVFDPISKELISLDDRWGINEFGVYSPHSCRQLDIPTEIIYHNGYLFQEEVIAREGEYKLVENAVIIGDCTYPLGFVLERNGGLIRHREKIVSPQCSPLIINQIDSDGEFLKESLTHINSQLTVQILFKDQFEFGMIQPEISFANSTDSLFARLLSWAHEEFKFAERTLFTTYQEANSYGKVSKALPLYVNNIMIKEAIPVIARTHDHWEAMALRTKLFISERPKQAKIIENVPSNFYSFLKRKQGWLAGDLLLLSLESKLGAVINYIRSLLYFIKGKIKLAGFWKNYTKTYFKWLNNEKRFYSALGEQRISTLNRTTLSTTFLMLWLITTGWVALVFPGALTTRNQFLAWMLFMLSVICIIILPKFFIPAWKLLLQELYRFSSVIYLGVISGLCYYLSKLIQHYPYLPQIFLILGCVYFLSRAVFLPIMFIIFGHRRRLRIRFGGFLGFFLLIVFILNFYDLLDLIAESKNFYWLPYIFLHQMPIIFTYLLPLLAISHFFPLGRRVIVTLKEGTKELVATTSTLLMLLIYEPFHILNVMIKLIWSPFQKIAWLPQSYFDRKSQKINSLFKAYIYFILPPLFSIVMIIIPVKLHLITSRILIYGWPIFVWSWLLGPFWAYWTARHRRSLTRQTPRNIILRKMVLRSYDFENMDLSQLQETVKSLPFVENEEDCVRIQLFMLIHRAFKSLPVENQKKIIARASQIAENQTDPRITDWNSLSEFLQVKLLKPYRKYIPSQVWNNILYLEALLFQMVKKGWAEVEWQNMSVKQRQKIKSRLLRKYHLA